MDRESNKKDRAEGWSAIGSKRKIIDEAELDRQKAEDKKAHEEANQKMDDIEASFKPTLPPDMFSDDEDDEPPQTDNKQSGSSTSKQQAEKEQTGKAASSSSGEKKKSHK
jgi:hypothetical protein